MASSTVIVANTLRVVVEVPFRERSREGLVDRLRLEEDDVEVDCVM